MGVALVIAGVAVISCGAAKIVVALAAPPERGYPLGSGTDT